MKAQFMAAAIVFLATLMTGCISQQDKGTMRQWQELYDHIWEETSPATSPAPADEQPTEEAQSTSPTTQVDKKVEAYAEAVELSTADIEVD